VRLLEVFGLPGCSACQFTRTLRKKIVGISNSNAVDGYPESKRITDLSLSHSRLSITFLAKI
jgi:hypothetical protein